MRPPHELQGAQAAHPALGGGRAGAHLIILILPGYAGYGEFPFQKVVEIALREAYCVQVKAPGLLTGVEWAELYEHHLAQFERILLTNNNKYVDTDSIEAELGEAYDMKLENAFRGDKRFKFHLNGFCFWLQKNVLKNTEVSLHVIYLHKRSDDLSLADRRSFVELRIGVEERLDQLDGSLSERVRDPVGSDPDWRIGDPFDGHFWSAWRWAGGDGVGGGDGDNGSLSGSDADGDPCDVDDFSGPDFSGRESSSEGEGWGDYADFDSYY